MNYEDKEQTYELVHGLTDRLLYLKDEDRQEFLRYLEALYYLFPIPRKVVYGKDIVNHESQDYGT
jgi:hypothetical protein